MIRYYIFSKRTIIIVFFMMPQDIISTEVKHKVIMFYFYDILSNIDSNRFEHILFIVKLFLSFYDIVYRSY